MGLGLSLTDGGARPVTVAVSVSVAVDAAESEVSSGATKSAGVGAPVCS